VPELDPFVRGVTHGANSAAAAIPKLIAGILRFNLIAVFLLYSYELTREFHSCLVSALIGLSAVAFLILLLVNFIAGWQENWKIENLQPADLGSVWAYAAPAAILILATALIGQSEPERFQFSSPLLSETTRQAQRLMYWMAHL